VSLNSAWIELNNARKTIRLAWEETRQQWKDRVGQDFEENHWAPLDAQVDAALRALDILAPILATAQRECS
jgi:hypothetical protein